MKKRGLLIYILCLIMAIIAILIFTALMWNEISKEFVKYLIAIAIIIAASQIAAYIIVKKRIIPMMKSLNDMDLATVKMRQEFSANISHELKTPLTSISGYSELIEEGIEDEEKRREFAHKIKKESERLLRLINDIIRISELDDAESLLEFEDVDLFKIVKEAISSLEQSATEHRVSLILDRLPVGSLNVNGDYSSLLELLLNLVDNAIRYNKEDGEVHIGIRKQENSISLYVADNGIGIPKKYQGRVFERFFRVDKSRSRKTGGTGLGLSIVKHIAIMHDADIEIESAEGKGTTIIVNFKK